MQLYKVLLTTSSNSIKEELKMVLWELVEQQIVEMWWLQKLINKPDHNIYATNQAFHTYISVKCNKYNSDVSFQCCYVLDQMHEKWYFLYGWVGHISGLRRTVTTQVHSHALAFNSYVYIQIKFK